AVGRSRSRRDPRGRPARASRDSGCLEPRRAGKLGGTGRPRCPRRPPVARPAPDRGRTARRLATPVGPVERGARSAERGTRRM
ncbi:MAG: hypothetical protein AVDCRST_MAG88-3413, partial [uncultured Thermomicrobiales bacterium]